MSNRLKRFFKWLLGGVLILLIVLLLLIIGIQIPYIQTKLVGIATNQLSKSLNTEVKVGSVSIDLMSRIHLNDILVRDYKKDTLIYVESLTNQHSFDFDLKKPFKFNDKKLELDGVKFYLDNTRIDSVFNLTRTFSKNKQKDTVNSKVSTTKKPILPFLNLGQILVKKLDFRLRDSYNFQTITLNVAKVDLDATPLKLSDVPWRLNYLKLNTPVIQLIHHPTPPKPKSYKPEYLKIPFNLDIHALSLKDASFRLYDEPLDKTRDKRLLSFLDLDVKNIQLEAENMVLRNPSIAAEILHLGADEKSGLSIRELKSKFFLSSTKMEAKDLYFQTENSKLQGYLRFDYQHMREYLRFAEWVKVTAKMKNSNLHLKDLAYFAESLRPWSHLNLSFSTQGSGTMNQLLLKNLSAGLNRDNMKVSGDLFVRDLFNGKGLYVDAHLNKAVLDKSDIEFVFQKKNLPQELSRLGRITYVGTFKGNPTKVSLTGRVHTAQGSASLADAMLDFSNPKLPSYKGNIAVEDLKIANIVSGQTPINRISARMFIDGKGFDLNTLQTYLKGHVRQIYIQNASYSNIDVDGTLDRKLFTGRIKSNDPSLLVDANGKISMRDANPNLELNFALKDIDLKKLGLTRKRLLLNTNVFAIGTGKTIDEMLGTMLLKDMYIRDMTQDGKRYEFSNLTLEKDVFEEGDKYINIFSEEIQGSMVGKFRVSEIPNLLKEYLISYLAIEEVRSNQLYNQTYFDLNLKIKNIQSYTKLFYEDLKNIGEGQLSLRFDGISNKMKIKGQLFQTEFLQFKVPKININSESSNTNFLTDLHLDSVFFQNKLAITPLKAQFSQLSEGLKLSVELLNRKDYKFVDFNAILKKSSEEFIFHVLPFTSYYGRKVWSVNPDNEIRLNTNTSSLFVRDFDLYKDRQKINIASKSSDLTVLSTQFEEVRIEELISGFLPILQTFKGELNGTLDIANPLKKPTPVANVDLKNISFDNEKIGNLSLKSDFNNEILNSNFSLSGERFNLSGTGVYNANPEIDSLMVRTNIQNVDLSIVNRYLKDLIYEMTGRAHGRLNLYGKLSRLQTEGKLIIDSVSTGITTLRTKFIAKNQAIDILPGKFLMNGFHFQDIEGNPALANGFVAHDNLKKFELFLDAGAEKLLCMNTTSKDNPNFYGTVYANADIKFRGVIGNRISLKASGSNLPKSVLTIAFANSHQTERYNFYEFVKRDTAATYNALQKAKKKEGGVNLDFDFDVNTFGKVIIVMDPTIEDRIECNGSGKILFNMTPETDMDIKGIYEVNSGTYLFTYQNLVQRLFYLERGGKIFFGGSPKDAKVDVTARFTTRASAQNLITAYFGASTDPRVINASKGNVKVNIYLKLQERLTAPKISYALEVEQNNPEVTAAFESIMATTKNNEVELNNQVLGLLLFQRFFPPSFAGFNNTNQPATNTVSSDLQNTALDVVTGKISGYITDWIQNTFRGMNFDLRLRGYNQTDRVANLTDTRNELKFAVSQKLLNDRLIFNLGGNYDFGRTQQSNTNNAYFGGDVDIEYLLTPQGNIRLKAYSTLSNDPLNSVYINKTGAGILFQKEFDKLSELIRSRKVK